MAEAQQGYSPLAEPGIARTDVLCNNCVPNKVFVVQLDFRINGNHIVHCPVCGHEHFRQIKDGKITDVRWNPHLPNIHVGQDCVWKADNVVVERAASTAAQFIRDAWLNRSGMSP